MASAGIDHVLALGVEAIVRHRQPLLDRLRAGLTRPDFLPLGSPASASPSLTFAIKDARARFDERLKAEKIKISTYPNRIRISPSVYNDADDVDRLIAVLTA